MKKSSQIIAILIIIFVIIAASAIWYTTDDSLINNSNNDRNDNNIGTNNESDIGQNPDENNNQQNETNNGGNVGNNTNIGFFNVTFEKEYLSGWSVNHSEIDSNVCFYIQNWEEWDQSFYLGPLNNLYYIDFVPDFNNYSYSYVYWEEKSTIGYEIEYHSIFYDNGTLKFFIYKIGPELGEAVGHAFSYPFSFIKIPKDQLEGYEVNEIIFL